MAKYLLDTNVLLALAWPSHEFHEAAHSWWTHSRKRWATCALTELAFIRLSSKWPIIQASMAGTGTPALAAAVSNAGGLGSLGVGATNAEHSIKTFCLWVATLGSNSRIV